MIQTSAIQVIELRLPEGIEVGTALSSGLIFAGISPETKKPFFVRPVDEELLMRWREAMEYAKAFKGHGKQKGAFRLAARGELSRLFAHKSAIGGFDESGHPEKGWYWGREESPPGQSYDEQRRDPDSGQLVWVKYTPPSTQAWTRNFSKPNDDGFFEKYLRASVRLVCD